MPVATARSVSLDGAVGHLVTIQADVSPGQVRVDLVGRVDQALGEARDRVRMAIINSDLDWPATKRVTVLLSPADLHKRGTHHDLGIALAVLAAEGSIAPELLAHCLFVGELTLDGSLRKVVRRPQGFDANFLGMTRETADLACRRLVARNVNCFMIGPSS